MNTVRRLMAATLAAAVLAPAGASFAAEKELVLVAGATGRVGVHIVRQLVAADYPVRALVRDAAAAKAELPEGVEIIAADVRDPATLSAPMQGAVYVISSIGAGGVKPVPGNGPEEVDYQGNVNLTKAAQAANVKHFVLVSSGATSKAENFPVPFMRPILAFKFRSEEFLRHSGMPYTVVKPGGLTDEEGGRNAIDLFQGDVNTMGRIPRVDVATVCVAALGNEQAMGKTFEVMGGKGPVSADWQARFAALKPDAAAAQAAGADTTR